MIKSFIAGILLGLVLSFTITGYAQEVDSSPGRTSATTPPSADKQQRFVLRISDPKPGAVYGEMLLGNEAVSMETLLDGFQKGTPKQREMLIIQSGRNVPHDQITKAMELAKRADVKKIGFSLVAEMSPRKGVRTESLETTELVNKGRELTEEEADKLEEKLRTNPDDLSTRTQLLGYYFLRRYKSAPARKNCQRHIIWIIQNHPSARIAGLPDARVDPVIDGEAYDRARQLWLKQVETYEKNTAILGNAAAFFLIPDMDISEDLLKKAQSLQPDNPQWSERLGHLYLLKMQKTSGEARSQVAGQALEQFERSFAPTTGERVRSPTYKLQYLAKAAFGAGDTEKARKYATELLDTASHYKSKPDQCSYSYYGHAVHHGNIILGRIALKSGDLKKAKKHLIEAGKTPGSPTLNSFGPNMALAKELLEKGERKVVIEYFQLCSKFWKMKRDRLEKWTTIVKEGEIPNFGGNLYY